MVVITGENSYSLYAHAGRRYNMIMDLKDGMFRFSTPNFAKEWPFTETIPKDVLKAYSKKEQIELLKYWNDLGYSLDWDSTISSLRKSFRREKT